MSEIPQDPSAQGDQPPPQPNTPPPPPPPPMSEPGPAYGAQAPVSPSDARMWSLFAHLGGIFFGFIPSLIIFVMFKDRDPFVRRHASQALNFQIIMTIAYIISAVLMLVLIGFLLLPAVALVVIVFSVIAAMAANRGEEYTYPMIPQMVT